MLSSTFNAVPEAWRDALAAVVVAAFLWLGWRLWRFTLAPALYPDSPKALPYLIPWVGHTLDLSISLAKVFHRGRKCFNYEIYSLTVLGKELYIATAPADVSAVFRENGKLSFDLVAKEAMMDFGWDKRSANIMFDNQGMAKHNVDRNHDDVKLQMHPGERLEGMQVEFLERMENLLQWERIGTPELLSGSDKSKIVSLWQWCGHVFVEATTGVIFGDSLFEMSPQLLADFFVWEKDAWKMHAKYPEFAAREMYAAKTRVQSVITKFLTLPKEKRHDESWFIGRFDERMKNSGIDDPAQRSALLVAMFRVTNGNAYRHAFWCLAYMLHNEALLAEARSETTRAFQDDGSFSMPFLLEHCPVLASVYEEALRFTVDPVGMRMVTNEVVLNGKKLLPGRVLLMPFRQSHFNPKAFGANAAEFDPYRFIKNKSLHRSASWRPFGGGLSFCPGRFISRREVYMFIALVLRRFDIRLDERAGKQKIPMPDESVPTGGVLPPMPGHEVRVEIKRV